MQYFKNLMAMAFKPYYSAVPMFDPRQDMTFIPDAGTNVPMQAPAETPDGETATFTFASTPKYILYNGQWRFENVGYTRSGTAIKLIDSNGAIVVPPTGASIKAVV